MTLICKPMALALTLFLACLSALATYGPAQAQPVQAPETPGQPVSRIELEGAERTRLEWIERYLGLTFPAALSLNELSLIEIKLMTTGVFSDVRAGLEPDPQNPSMHILKIRLEEKWTTIPVVRGAFGGGTPLTVLGVYDTHTFGSLWTLGFETQKYGDAPPGGVLWARNPRWLRGRHFVSYELWKDNRIRTIYDRKDKALGSYHSQGEMLRVQYLLPLGSAFSWRESGQWQLGIDFKARIQKPTTFEPAKGRPGAPPPDDIEADTERHTESRPLLKLVYDDMIANAVDHQGARLIATWGPVITSHGTHSLFELEAFRYWFLPHNSNLALHGLIGGATNRSLQDTYFLGGFDSIRGLPDGAIYGNKAAYFNVELRKMSWRSKYVWLQNAVFFDAGSAASKWDDLSEKARSSAGIGIRLSVPQVYRLMFRIDYAWSLDRPGTSGITAGMNQFFQPYKPL